MAQWLAALAEDPAPYGAHIAVTPVPGTLCHLLVVMDIALKQYIQTHADKPLIHLK